MSQVQILANTYLAHCPQNLWQCLQPLRSWKSWRWVPVSLLWRRFYKSTACSHEVALSLWRDVWSLGKKTSKSLLHIRTHPEAPPPCCSSGQMGGKQTGNRGSPKQTAAGWSDSTPSLAGTGGLQLHASALKQVSPPQERKTGKVTWIRTENTPSQDVDGANWSVALSAYVPEKKVFMLSCHKNAVTNISSWNCLNM